MTKNIRLGALLLTVLMTVVIFSSVVYIAAEADHDCSGDNCPVCYHISICENTLKAVGIVCTALIFIGFSGIFALSLFSLSFMPVYGISLVTLKVKLSD